LIYILKIEASIALHDSVKCLIVGLMPIVKINKTYNYAVCHVYGCADCIHVAVL